MSLTLFPDDGPGAAFSSCGRYRYRLWRPLARGARTVLWVMLNPSTAGAEEDDPTIRKCRGFSSRWGFHRLEVVNLFAYRATDPCALRGRELAHFIGPDNNAAIADAASRADAIVLAWGRAAGADRSMVRLRAKGVAEALSARVGKNVAELQCLGLTLTGAYFKGEPRHPLMLAYDTPLERYDP